MSVRVGQKSTVLAQRPSMGIVRQGGVSRKGLAAGATSAVADVRSSTPPVPISAEPLLDATLPGSRIRPVTGMKRVAEMKTAPADIVTLRMRYAVD
jgi:hypothetical protein